MKSGEATLPSLTHLRVGPEVEDTGDFLDTISSTLFPIQATVSVDNFYEEVLPALQREHNKRKDGWTIKGVQKDGETIYIAATKRIDEVWKGTITEDDKTFSIQYRKTHTTEIGYQEVFKSHLDSIFNLATRKKEEAAAQQRRARAGAVAALRNTARDGSP